LRPVYDASKRKNRNDSRRYYDQTDCHSILIALETVLKLKAVTQQAVHVWSVLLRALEELRSAVILRQTKLQQEAIRVATTRQSVASRLIDTGYFYEPGSLAVMVLDNGTSPIAECHKELAAKVCTLRILELANINLFANTVYLYCHLSYIYMYITLYAVGLLIGPSASVHGTGSMQYFDGAGSFSINELSSGFSAENNLTYCNSFGQGHYYPCSEVFCGTTFLPLLIQQAWMHFKHKSDGLFIRIQTLLDNIDAATVSGGSAMKVDSEGTSIATPIADVHANTDNAAAAPAVGFSVAGPRSGQHSGAAKLLQLSFQTDNSSASIAEFSEQNFFHLACNRLPHVELPANATALSVLLKQNKRKVT